MTVAIIGNGAIGNLLAFQCDSQGIDYCLITREGNEKTLCCTSSVLPLSANVIHPVVYDIKHLPETEFVVLPLKAFDIEPALMQLQPHLSATTTIILLHNGMLELKPIENLLPTDKIISATTTYGAYKSSSQNLAITGKGRTDAGWLKPDNNAEHALPLSILNALLPPCTWHQDIRQALWLKLAINAVINPLTAIERVNNGELLNDRFAPKIKQIADEIALVMDRCGYQIEAQKLIEHAKQVMKNTAANQSSMLQDIVNNRRTEIEFITGHIVKTAHQFNIDVPCNYQLLQTVRNLQSI